MIHQSHRPVVRRLASPIAASLLFLGITGCGGSADRPTASQVAARVGSHEITIHQVNAELASLGNVAADQLKHASAAVLERLIDQELLLGQAEEQKIDRDPEVMAAVSAARRGIVARAYLERVTTQAPRPDSGEIKRFYAENPELFSKRRIYALRELRIAQTAGREAELRAVIDKSSKLDEVAAWLRRENVQFSAENIVKPAEELPLDMIKQLSAMHEGQIGVLTAPAGTLVVQMAGMREQPIDEASATPVIERYLTNRKKEELAREELRRLRERTGIDYVGEFNVKTANVEAANPAAPSGIDPAVLQKGVGGLR